MNLFGSLYGKFAIAMVVLFIILGAALVAVTNHTSTAYSLEITQSINRDIALHAAEDMPLYVEGQVNESALKELAHHVMFINPIVEVYLLGLDGRVLSHALPYESVLLDQVDMRPLTAFMSESTPLPIFGEDPREPDKDKVFSVSPILERGEPVAYLYTVLNGKAHDGLREAIQDSYILQIGTAALLGSLLVGVIAGLSIFALLTRRLQKLIGAVKTYREGSFEGQIDLPVVRPDSDELGQLGEAIVGMSRRIETQFNAQQELDKNRRELIANISHDLRTPLASMQGYLETVLSRAKTLSEDEQRKYLNIAYKHSRRLNQLIGELFELAKLESGSMKPKLESFPLMELVQDLVQDYELEAQNRKLSLTAQCSNFNVMVCADIALIHRVLENLLQNAFRHSHEGGVVSLKVSMDAEKVWIEVEDNGEGIAADEIPHIFDRFYRPETSHSQTGLGLAIVKRILDLHSSEVGVRSEPDKSTCFSFWLPQAALPG